jgi:hypothetical protein
MTYLDNYRTHFCPDSGFSLVSENDLEFEACHCFQAPMNQSLPFGSAEYDAVSARSSTILAEQIWYRTIAALAKVCGTGRTVQFEPAKEHHKEQVPVTVRKL